MYKTIIEKNLIIPPVRSEATAVGYNHSLEATFWFFLCIFKFPAHFFSKMAGECKYNNGREEEKGDGSVTFWRPTAGWNLIVLAKNPPYGRSFRLVSAEGNSGLHVK